MCGLTLKIIPSSPATVRSVPEGSASRRTFCRYCGDVIGVYEPTVLRTPTGDHVASLAAEPDWFPTDEDCYHEACYLLAVARAPED
jgi:hypothetical protein